MSAFIASANMNDTSGTDLDKRRRLSMEDDIDSQYAKKRAGRKAIEEDNSENSSDDPANKRKAQNRAAQKAFRERKLNHIRVLEKKIEVLQKKEDEKNQELQSENEKLRLVVEQLEKEKSLLLGASMSIDYMQQHHRIEPLQQQQQQEVTDILPLDVNTMQWNQHELQIDKYMGVHHDDTNDIVAHTNNDMPKSKCPTPEDVAKAWDALYSHPRFDEFDHKLICGEIRRKMNEDGGIDHSTAVQRVVDEHYPVHDFLK